MTAATDPASGVALEGVTDGQSPDGDLEATAGSQDRGGSEDYKARIRAGGDFAVDEATKHQSRADRLEAENRKLVDSLGGNAGVQRIAQILAQGVTPETVANTVINYAMMKQDPKLAKIVQTFEQTGQYAPDTNGGDPFMDDEYLTDEQKKIRELEQRLVKYEGQLGNLFQGSGTAALQGHLEKISSHYELTEKEFEDLKGKMLPQINDWGKSYAGRDVLRSLQNPGGYDTVRAFALRHIPDEVLSDLGNRRRLREQKRVEGFRTDGPPESTTSGREPPPEVKTAREAFKYAKANPDRI